MPGWRVFGALCPPTGGDEPDKTGQNRTSRRVCAGRILAGGYPPTFLLRSKGWGQLGPRGRRGERAARRLGGEGRIAPL